MPYTVPTVDDFTTRFPIFADKDEDAMTAIIAEAASQIDTTWREADYQPAIMYLAAHMLAMDNSEAGEEVEIGAGIASESFGGMSVSYASSSGGGTVNKYEDTEYGRRFLRLLRNNRGGPVVI